MGERKTPAGPTARRFSPFFTPFPSSTALSSQKPKQTPLGQSLLSRTPDLSTPKDKYTRSPFQSAPFPHLDLPPSPFVSLNLPSSPSRTLPNRCMPYTSSASSWHSSLYRQLKAQATRSAHPFVVSLPLLRAQLSHLRHSPFLISLHLLYLQSFHSWCASQPSRPLPKSLVRSLARHLPNETNRGGEEMVRGGRERRRATSGIELIWLAPFLLSLETDTLSRPSASQDSDPGFGWIAIG